MIFRNICDSKYLVRFMRATEEKIINMGVSEWIKYLRTNAEYEGNDTIVINSDFIVCEVYVLHETKSLRKEFLVGNNRVFLSVNLNTRAELINK